MRRSGSTICHHEGCGCIQIAIESAYCEGKAPVVPAAKLRTRELVDDFLLSLRLLSDTAAPGSWDLLLHCEEERLGICLEVMPSRLS